MLNNQRVEYTLIVSRIYGFLIFEQLTNGLLGKWGNLASIFASSDHGAFRFNFPMVDPVPRYLFGSLLATWQRKGCGMGSPWVLWGDMLWVMINLDNFRVINLVSDKPMFPCIKTWHTYWISWNFSRYLSSLCWFMLVSTTGPPRKLTFPRHGLLGASSHQSHPQSWRNKKTQFWHRNVGDKPHHHFGYWFKKTIET